MVGTKWLLAVGTESVFGFDVERMPKSFGMAEGGKNRRRLSAGRRGGEAGLEQTARTWLWLFELLRPRHGYNCALASE
jgi:hypothetical protein